MQNPIEKAMLLGNIDSSYLLTRKSVLCEKIENVGSILAYTFAYIEDENNFGIEKKFHPPSLGWRVIYRTFMLHQESLWVTPEQGLLHHSFKVKIPLVCGIEDLTLTSSGENLYGIHLDHEILTSLLFGIYTLPFLSRGRMLHSYVKSFLKIYGSDWKKEMGHHGIENMGAN